MRIYVSNVLKYLYRRLTPKKLNPISNIPIFKHDLEKHLTEPSVCVIIPSRDNSELLRKCIESIKSKTKYSNYELLIVDNQSEEKESLSYFEDLRSSGIRVVSYPLEFNYSQICNYAISLTKSTFVCLLNNDTEVLEGSWLTKLVEHACSPGVGIVGAILKYPQGNRIQHAGIALGFKGIAGYPTNKYRAFPELNQKCFAVSAVSFACVVFRRSLLSTVGELDERFPRGLNDVDYCIRVNEHGLKNIVCGETQLMHVESASRGGPFALNNLLRNSRDIKVFLQKHSRFTFRDEYFK